MSLSDVLVAWRYLLRHKLHLLPRDHLTRPENYELVRAAYESFLSRSNTVDLMDVHSLYLQLSADPGTGGPLSPVS